MSKAKKVFEPVLAILTAALAANPKVKLVDVMDEVNEACRARVGEGSGGKATTFVKNAEGVVVAIRDFYFGKWFDPRVVPTGLKANTPSGYNSMSKAGLNQWTKQQNDAKKAKDALLAAVGAGEIAADQVSAKLQEIEEARAAIIEAPVGENGEQLYFDSVEDLVPAV